MAIYTESGSAQDFCLLMKFFLATIASGLLTVAFCPGSRFSWTCKLSQDNAVMNCHLNKIELNWIEVRWGEWYLTGVLIIISFLRIIILNLTSRWSTTCPLLLRFNAICVPLSERLVNSSVVCRHYLHVWLPPFIASDGFKVCAIKMPFGCRASVA